MITDRNSLAVFPRYPGNGPSSRVRFFQYFPFLRAAGFQLKICPFFDEGYIDALFQAAPRPITAVLRSYIHRLAAAFAIRSGQIVWLQYEWLPWLPFFFERMLIGRRARLVIDYDDAVFHRYDRHHLGLVRRLLGKKIDRLMNIADVVIAGNPYLAERAIRAGAGRVEIIPSVVDLSRYPLKPLRKGKDAPLRVGWVGSPGTARYILEIEAVIRDLSGQGIEFVIIGARKPPGLAALPVIELGWSLETEAQLIHSLDIGIMPLPDTPFERGKCGYKLIQYMACGLPVVASPVGVNREIVRHGENGFLAQTHEEWVRALTHLIDHPAERASMGARGRELVEEYYSLQMTAPRLVETFRSLQV